MASWISRKRWEYREQALAALQLQAEIQGVKKTGAQPASNELVARDGVNRGKPPLSALAKIGVMVPQ